MADGPASPAPTPTEPPSDAAQHNPTTHPPSRPSWRCENCGKPWPCEQRREELLAEFRRDRLALLLYLAAHLVDAVDDFQEHGTDVAPDLYGRFMGWARRHPAGTADSDRP
ncbi:hypothetical protein [Actinoplanes lobatus]|uniref:Flavin reductase n=1 Tax=Actinoplanes lobatus TaxID=113568 RepID=A0A7W7MK29_9ACTN|nr:hypothetical protein [Actinoplanes lobatus]MBB4752625.1 hypothetical protein [Actinoplanes lobatus]